MVWNQSDPPPPPVYEIISQKIFFFHEWGLPLVAFHSGFIWPHFKMVRVLGHLGQDYWPIPIDLPDLQLCNYWCFRSGWVAILIELGHSLSVCDEGATLGKVILKLLCYILTFLLWQSERVCFRFRHHSFCLLLFNMTLKYLLNQGAQSTRAFISSDRSSVFILVYYIPSSRPLFGNLAWHMAHKGSPPKNGVQ